MPKNEFFISKWEGVISESLENKDNSHQARMLLDCVELESTLTWMNTFLLIFL